MEKQTGAYGLPVGLCINSMEIITLSEMCSIMYILYHWISNISNMNVMKEL